MSEIQTHNFSGDRQIVQVVVNPTTICSRPRRFLIKSNNVEHLLYYFPYLKKECNIGGTCTCTKDMCFAIVQHCSSTTVLVHMLYINLLL
jgi:hypothetical protein